jgi:hypothetical protein
MPEHKFTDEEIIRALEICAQNTVGGEGYFTYQGIPLRYLCEDALDLINRQREEIEVIKETTAEIRYEAVKEFAQRLKTYYRNLDKTAGALIEYHIDEIVKEMLEGG